MALHTELGPLRLAPGEIAVIPRGIRFRVELLDGPARGYLCENYGAPFTLPERGPIGANGLASERDFLAPTAAFEDRPGRQSVQVVQKFGGNLWAADYDHSPLDVVGWHGNYTPVKYDNGQLRHEDHRHAGFDYLIDDRRATSPAKTLAGQLDSAIFLLRLLFADTPGSPHLHRLRRYGTTD